MVSPPKDNLMDGSRPALDAQLSLFPEPRQVARRSSHRPCPNCGSITVRSRDGRDMCLICGYLQSHA
jgi:ribosomal protein S27AE